MPTQKSNRRPIERESIPEELLGPIADLLGSGLTPRRAAAAIRGVMESVAAANAPNLVPRPEEARLIRESGGKRELSVLNEELDLATEASSWWLVCEVCGAEWIRRGENVGEIRGGIIVGIEYRDDLPDDNGHPTPVRAASRCDCVAGRKYQGIPFNRSIYKRAAEAAAKDAA